MKDIETRSERKARVAAEEAAKVAAGTETQEEADAKVSSVDDTQALESVPLSETDSVIVTVPKKFALTLGHGLMTILPGVQKMEKAIAEHWYAKANGVEIFKE